MQNAQHNSVTLGCQLADVQHIVAGRKQICCRLIRVGRRISSPNFEWIFGYVPKFGLIAVDPETQTHTIKPSATMLGKVAKSNSLQ